MLRSIAAGGATVVGLGGSASAKRDGNQKLRNTVVEPLDVDPASARASFKSATTSRLFDSLATDGYLNEPSIGAIPFEELNNESLPGGIERLEVNGNLEQYNVHIPLNGDLEQYNVDVAVDVERLEIMLPLSDLVPTAYVHRENGPEIVYGPDNYYQGEELEVSSTDVELESSCEEPLFRSCVTCWACCGFVEGWQRNEVKEPCPNCLLTHCHWVKESCCF